MSASRSAFRIRLIDGRSRGINGDLGVVVDERQLRRCWS
jgi:hypothetical protein